DRRIEQFAADLARERALVADAEAALGRLDAEGNNLRDVAHETDTRLDGANAQVNTAESSLAQSEKSFAELTGALADLTARRNQLQAALRGHEQRAGRLAAELGEIEAGLAKSGTDAPDLSALVSGVAGAQSVLTEAEAAAQAAAAAHRPARGAVGAARDPPTAAARPRPRLRNANANTPQAL